VRRKALEADGHGLFEGNVQPLQALKKTIKICL